MSDKKDAPASSGPPIAGLLVAYTSVGIDMLGLSIILPVIPFYAVQFNASPFMLGTCSSGTRTYRGDGNRILTPPPPSYPI